jgi:hypothetical protein
MVAGCAPFKGPYIPNILRQKIGQRPSAVNASTPKVGYSELGSTSENFNML